MTDRLSACRAHITDALALDEYKTRMGGYVDAALSLIGIVARDALENLERNPTDETTKQVVVNLSTATQALEPLVALLCPMTAAPCPSVAETPLAEQEAAGHG